MDSFLWHLEVMGGVTMLQKKLFWWLFPLLKMFGNLSLKKKKQLSIYVPFIPKTFNYTSGTGNDNFKSANMPSCPFFLALGSAFLMEPLHFLSPHASPCFPCLLAWICLVESISRMKIERYSPDPEVGCNDVHLWSSFNYFGRSSTVRIPFFLGWWYP